MPLLFLSTSIYLFSSIYQAHQGYKNLKNHSPYPQEAYSLVRDSGINVQVYLQVGCASRKDLEFLRGTPNWAKRREVKEPGRTSGRE